MCLVNLISANREKWINSGKANTVANRREKESGGEGTVGDGWRAWRDNKVTGVTAGTKGGRERNEQWGAEDGGKGTVEEQ